MVNMHITEEIDDELRMMQAYLEVNVSDNPSELIERLGTLNVYMARTGYLLAVAKADLDEAMSSAFAERSETIERMPATIGQKFISSQCRVENYYATWIERLNRECVHQCDNLRTMISFAKESMRLENLPHGNR